MPRNLRNFPKRGDIYTANLDPSFGREIRKKRPVLIISNDIINQNSSTVIVLPMSSIIPQFVGPDLVEIPGSFGLAKESVILTTQIRSIDKERLVKKIGRISTDIINDVEAALRIVLGLDQL